MNIRMTEEQYIAHQRMATAAKTVKPMDKARSVKDAMRIAPSQKPKPIRARNQRPLRKPKPTPQPNIPVRSEHQIQSAFIRRLQLLPHPELSLAFAVPNGGKRHGVIGAMLKAEGTRRGVPDWHLPCARKKFSGLWIEFKRPGGKLSEHQVEYIAMLRREDHFVEVCDDDAEAEIIVRRYLGEDIPRLKGKS